MANLIHDKEHQERLIAMVSEVIRSDALEDEDAVAIIDICQAACQRKQIELEEEYLKKCFGGGKE